MSFRATIEAAGLRPREVVADGRIRRCRTESKPQHRNGWYVLHPDGRGYWGDWTSGTGSALGEWKDSTTSYTPPSAAVLAKIQAQRERDRAYRQSAIRGARAYWAKARPLNRLHPYIERKGLTPLGCAGLRQHDGLLVVPVMWGDTTLTSVQTISPTGEKLFWPGAPVDGGAYVLRRPGAAVTVFAEGLSTALAVFQAVRMASVVCAFNAGNLTKVAQHLKPTGSVVFCADNDHVTLAKRGFNPGIQAATNAADLLGAGVWWPEGIEGTDAADFLAEVGEGAPRKLERLILAKARYVMSTA